MKSRFRVALTGLVGLGMAVPASFGQEPPIPIPQRSAAVAANARGGVVTGRLNVESLASSIDPKAVIKVDGTAAPGLKITLDGSASSGGRVWYKWFQTQGPRVSIAGIDQAVARFTVPDEGTSLGFVLVVGNSVGIDVRAVVVEVEDFERDSNDRPLKADAGPDLTAVVGKRVTLDGSKSEPKGRVRYRWVQSSGPKASIHGSGGPTCSFVPDAPGAYQFALLVLGDNNLVSEAALVTVQAKVPRSESSDPTAAGDHPVMAIDELARAALASITGGSRYAGELSRDFDLMANKIDSFKTYGDATTELTRRLNAVVPSDPSHRSEWIERFFKPWSAKVTEAMRGQGLDLAQPSGQSKPLSRAQRAYLADQFRFTAAGLRAGTSLR